MNVDRKYDEVVREVNALRGTLPQGLTQLQVQRARTTEVAIVQVALVSDSLPMRRLEKVADRLRERLDRVPGVRKAQYWGATPSELRVSLDLARLVSSGGLAGELAKMLCEPVTEVARAKLWANSGLESLQAQLEAAKVSLPGPSAGVLELAVGRALELVTSEEGA